MSTDTLPSIDAVVAAVQRRDHHEARALLAPWGIPLKRRYLLTESTWVIGQSIAFEFQLPLMRRLKQLPSPPGAPRIFMGNWAFWWECSLAMWKAEQYEELQRRLPGLLEEYNPAVYLVWGRLLARDQHHVLAGMYLLLSGMATPEERVLCERFKQRCQKQHPNQIVAAFPRSIRTRRARWRFPEQVYTDLAEVPCPAWWRRRPKRP